MFESTKQTAAKPIVLTLRKPASRELYKFRYDAETRYDLLDRLERYASDDRLSFDFDDLYFLREVILAGVQS